MSLRETLIRGYCRTNIDEYKTEDWPTAFVEVPREGDMVRAESGRVLGVCQVTHCQALSRATIPRFAGSEKLMPGDPYIEVELTRTWP